MLAFLCSAFTPPSLFLREGECAVIVLSPPVMAWRHPDVCNRHQKSSGPGE